MQGGLLQFQHTPCSQPICHHGSHICGQEALSLHATSSESRSRLRWGIAQRLPNAPQRRKRTPHNAQKCWTNSTPVGSQPPTVPQRKGHSLGNLVKAGDPPLIGWAATAPPKSPKRMRRGGRLFADPTASRGVRTGTIPRDPAPPLSRATRWRRFWVHKPSAHQRGQRGLAPPPAAGVDGQLLARFRPASRSTPTLSTAVA